MKKKSKYETMEFIKAMADNVKKVEAMTDDELSDALRKDVWQWLDMDSMESALTGEAIWRINGCTVAPEGWRCTRNKGHEGPCAAIPINRD